MYIKEFLGYCGARNLSALTLKQYRTVLKELYQFAAENGKDVDDLNPSDIANYQLALSQRIKPQSVNNHLSAVRSYYAYMCKFQGMTANPALTVSPCKVANLLPMYISQNTMEKMLCELPLNTPKQRRNYTMLALFYMTGARCAEVLALSVNDLNFEESKILLYGKGRKQRYVPMCSKLRHILVDYLRTRPASRHANLFLTTAGEPMAEWQLRAVITRILCRYVPREYAHPHILRHTFATVLLNHGKPIEQISKWMGHTSISVTERYLTIVSNPIANNFNNVF